MMAAVSPRGFVQANARALALGAALLFAVIFASLLSPSSLPLRLQGSQASLSDALLSLPAGQRHADALWEALLTEGEERMLRSSRRAKAPGPRLEVLQGLADVERFLAIEVGVHLPAQCVKAAEKGFRAHCVEPSPRSVRRFERKVETLQSSVANRLTLHPKAASATSGATLTFQGSGGSGDHVGSADMWRMSNEGAQDPSGKQKSDRPVQVETLALDDLLSKVEGEVWILKVDVQGFEPSVLHGVRKSLADGRVRFLLLEYWPKGVDLLHHKPMGSCYATRMLQELYDMGYDLYATGVIAHPAAPPAEKAGREEDLRERPLALRANCKWYYDRELKYSATEGDRPYAMGYWSDVLAVRREGTRDGDAYTAVGKALAL